MAAAVVPVLTVVVAVVAAVSRLTSQASFQDQLLVVPWHYLLLHILFRVVEVLVNLVEHQVLDLMMLEMTENPQHSMVQLEVVVDELDSVVRHKQFLAHSKLVVADPVSVQVVAVVQTVAVVVAVDLVIASVVMVPMHRHYLLGLVAAVAALVDLLLVLTVV